MKIIDTAQLHEVATPNDQQHDLCNRPFEHLSAKSVGNQASGLINLDISKGRRVAYCETLTPPSPRHVDIESWMQERG
jgi:hypothetical protein